MFLHRCINVWKLSYNVSALKNNALSEWKISDLWKTINLKKMQILHSISIVGFRTTATTRSRLDAYKYWLTLHFR